MAIYATAIPQVEPPLVGVHVLWNGPGPWVYSPTGWTVQRRLQERRAELDCLSLSPSDLQLLRSRHVFASRFGVFTDRLGECPKPLVAIPSPTVTAAIAVGVPLATAAIVVPSPCEIVTLELHAPQPFVRVQAQAKSSMAVALRDGKAVAGGREFVGTGVHDLAAEGIDTVIVVARGLTGLMVCLRRAGGIEEGWDTAPVVARLQLPIRPLMPLADAAAELAEARSRLLPGEDIDAGEFAHLADLIRGVVEAAGLRRPIDLTLLLKSDAEMDAEEMAALDPLRAVLPHPTWRRALGFSWFDRDPALVPGQIYEYRVSAGFPGADLVDQVYGFHTVPAGTPLPAELYLHDLRLRLPQPTTVERFDAPGPVGTPVYTRHGVRLTSVRAHHWLGPSLDGWSAVIDLPRATKTLTLLLRGAHTLTVAGGAAWLPWGSATDPVPQGEQVTVTFEEEVHQVRFMGEGFLCGIRLPADPPAADGIATISPVLPPVTLVNTPRPAAPLSASIANLQAPQPVAIGDVPESLAAPRHELGFEVRWMPAPLGAIAQWPPSLPPPPSEATLFQVEHQQTDSTATWTSILDGDNIITGHRDASPPLTDAAPGVDLMELYPEVRMPASGPGDLTWPDVFDFATDGGPVRRPPPPPGTHHRYRIRAVDAIGRPGDDWIETDTRRLEKWAPPPLPVGPDPTPAGSLARPAPTGVHARVLVRDAPDLSDDERARLGTHDNAILLRWGWHAAQREQDAFATEFRVYLSRRNPTAVGAVVTSVTDVGGGRYDVALALDRPVFADAARNLRLEAGYPFKIVTHGAGVSIVATVVAFVPLANGNFPVPELGPVPLPVRLTPDATRPPTWGARREVVPLSAAVAYESAPIFDALDLTETHPRDEIWISVTSADAQPYVPDALAPIDDRPGNESAIVPIRVQARYCGRPTIAESPSLAPVPVVVAPEPAARPMEVRLDLASLLAGTPLAPGERVRLERTSDAQVFQAYRAEGSRVIARVLEPVRSGDAESEVTVANAADRAAIVAALDSSSLMDLEDRFVVFLAASHPFRERLFRASVAADTVLPMTTDVLPNVGARHVYRARRLDAAGHASADGVTLKGVVRVPSTSEIATPFREPRLPGDPDTRLRFLVDAGDEIFFLLVFHRVAPGDASPEELPELVRVPSAPRLGPAERAKLRTADGAFLAATAVIDLPAAVPGEPRRNVIADVPIEPGASARTWVCAMTRDGVTSPLAGPFRVSRAPLPLASPTLVVTGSAPVFQLSWSWPVPSDASDVVVERSTDGVKFARVSARLAATATSTEYRAPAGPAFVRLRARRPDGRTAVSNVVGI